MDHVRNPDLPWQAVEYIDGVTVYYPLGPWGIGWEGKASGMRWSDRLDLPCLAVGLWLFVQLYDGPAEWIVYALPILTVYLLVGWVLPFVSGLRPSKRHIRMGDWDDLQGQRSGAPAWVEIAAWLVVLFLNLFLVIWKAPAPLGAYFPIVWALVSLSRRILSYRRTMNGATNLSQYFIVRRRSAS